jgi:hypothetical protein
MVKTKLVNRLFFKDKPPLFAAILLAAVTSFAISASASDVERMTVVERALIFNTDNITGAQNTTPFIIHEDVNLFGELLMNYPEVDTIIVSGAGGSTSAAYDIANKVSEFGLTTIARNNCSSACTIIFLGGAKRELERGARLGFHRTSRGTSDMRDFYTRNKDDAGWVDEFAFAQDVFEEGQISARVYIEFATRRGVKLDFALRVISYSPEDLWYPTEAELIGSGILSQK